MMQISQMKSPFKVQKRKFNFTTRELNELLVSVSKRRKTILRGASSGQDQWASAWIEVAQEVSLVEGILRTDADVRKKWTYLKWEAINTTKPHRDRTSKEVLNILTKENVRHSRRYSPRNVNGRIRGSLPSKEKVLPSFRTQKCTPPVNEDDSSLCIQWNTYGSNMSTMIPKLLVEEKFVDVTLACDSRFIKCHKVILSACSIYFEELLSRHPSRHPIILMKDFKFWEIEAIVDFMYKGVVNIQQEDLPRLLQAANALSIKGLMTNKRGDDVSSENNTADSKNELNLESVSSTSTRTCSTVSSGLSKTVGRRKKKKPPRKTKLTLPDYGSNTKTEDLESKSCHSIPNVTIKNEPYNGNSDEENSSYSAKSETSLFSVTVKEEFIPENFIEENSANSDQYESVLFSDLTANKTKTSFYHSQDSREEFSIQPTSIVDTLDNFFRNSS